MLYYTTSEVLAEKIGMGHSNLLRKVDKLYLSPIFKSLAKCADRKTARYKIYRNYLMTPQATLYVLLSLTEARYKKLQLSVINQLPSDGYLCLHALLDSVLIGWSCAEDINTIVSVYIITDGDRIKVGRSKNVEDRVTQLQTSNPKKLSIKAQIPLSSNSEASSLELFIHSALRGFSPSHASEWFDISFDKALIFLSRYLLRLKRKTKNTWLLSVFLSQHNTSYTDTFNVYNRIRKFLGCHVVVRVETDPEECYTISSTEGELLTLCYTQKDAETVCNTLGLIPV